MPQHTTEQKKHFTALREFAAAVDHKIKLAYGEDGTREYILLDSKGEQLVMEYDMNDMVDSLRVYAGGHINFAHALADFNYQTEEDS